MMGRRTTFSSKIVRRIGFDTPRRATSMAWSHDGKRLAVGGMLDDQVTVLDAASGERLPAPRGHVGGIHDLAFSPDGRYLAIVRAPSAARAGGAERYTVSLWSAETGERAHDVVELDTTDVPEIAARSVAFSGDGRYLAIAYTGGTSVYALAGDGGLHRVSTLDVSASRCAFQPGAPVLAALQLGRYERAVVMRVSDGRVLQRLEDSASALAWSPDGRMLARMTGSRVAAVVNVVTGAYFNIVADDASGPYHSVSFSADGTLLAAGSPGRITVWDARTWAEAAVVNVTATRLCQMGFSPAGNVLAGVGEHSVTLWELARHTARMVPTGYTPRPRVHARPQPVEAPVAVETEVEVEVEEELAEATR
jgi:WD40 repeat protein